MSIAVRCEECDRTYQVRDKMAGRKGRCPKGHSIRVPAPAGESSAAGAATNEPTGEYVDTGSAFGAEEFDFPTQLAGSTVREAEEGPARKTGRHRRPEPKAVGRGGPPAGKPSLMPLLLGGIIGLVGAGAGAALFFVGRGQVGPLKEQAEAAEKKAQAADERARTAESNRLLMEAELDKLKKNPPRDGALAETQTKLKAAEKRAAEAERKLAVLAQAGPAGGAAAMPGKGLDPDAPGGKKDPVMPGGKLGGTPAKPEMPAPKKTEPAPKKNAPPAKEDTPNLKDEMSARPGGDLADGLPLGGKNWAAFGSITIGDKTVKAGDLIWLWPLDDTPPQVAGGKLTIRYRWKLRSGKTLPDVIGITLTIHEARQVRTAAGRVNLTGAGGEGEATIDVPGLAGDMPVHFFLGNAEVKDPVAYSSILAFQVDFGPAKK